MGQSWPRRRPRQGPEHAPQPLESSPSHPDLHPTQNTRLVSHLAPGLVSLGSEPKPWPGKPLAEPELSLAPRVPTECAHREEKPLFLLQTMGQGGV